MLIDKLDIEKAKEKLGDKNADIMAELLELENYDEKNMKACCPYHAEKTSSFIYNKKKHQFHCFGCSRTVDIIDVLVGKGNTFLEAAKYLFEQAGVEYSFGEKDVQTKHNYKYPKEEPLNDRMQVAEYLGKRGISKNVIDYLDIRQDSFGNAVFNFYDTNDVLTMVKYRPSHSVDKHSGQPKTWCQKGADTAPLLYNMNRVNTSKPLLITEGECDTASAIEAGYINTVSVPLGAGNLHWIEENWDWLNSFDSIIIWSDNDDAGIKMRKECIYRLGSWRTKYIETPPYIEKNGKNIPLKDVNDCLQIGGREFVLNLISEAKDVPVTSVVDYSDVEELDFSTMEGVKTGIKPLDEAMWKLYYGTLTILSGTPGSGKSSLVDQIIANTIEEDKPTFLYSRELNSRLLSAWLNSILAGRRNMVKKKAPVDDKEYYVVPYSIQKEMQAFYSKKLFIYKDDEPNDVDSILQSAEDCVRKFGCKLVILDNLMMMDLHCVEAEKNTAQTALINRLIKFSVKFNVAVILVCHPRKMMDANADIAMYDIAGSSNIINLAMRSIGLRRVSKKEKEDPKCKWKDYDAVLTVIKDRMFGKSDYQLGLWYDIVSRRFYTDYAEYDLQYKWDKKKYAEKLPYEDRHKKDEFPDK